MKKSRMRRAVLASVCTLLVLLSSMNAAGDPEPRPPGLVNDLVAALTLQGIRCDEVTDLERKGEKNYEVECQEGGRFQVSEKSDGGLGIFNLIGGVARLGVAGLGHVLRLPGQILGLGRDTVEHSAEVALGLFAIVKLSGGNCDEVIDVRQQSDTDHTVACRNGQTHRVFTNDDGLVVVEQSRSGAR